MVLVMLVAASLSVAVGQLALGASLALFLVVARRDGWRRTGLERPALALLIWAVAMVPLALDPSQALHNLRRFYLFAVWWVVAAAAVDETARRRMFMALAAGSVIAAVWGVIDVVQRYGDLFARRAGHISNPMTTAALLMMGALVCGAVAVTPRLGRRWRVAAGVAGAVVLLGLVQTMTRSALLGAACGLGVMGLMRWSRRGTMAAAVIGVVMVTAVTWAGRAPESRIARRISLAEITSGRSTSMRVENWRAGMSIVAARPWTGVGDISLASVTPQFHPDIQTRYLGHMHSNLVQFAVIWGVPGFVLAMTFLAAQLVILARRWRRVRTLGDRGPPWAVAWLTAAIGVWVAFFVAGLTEWYFGDAEPFLLATAIYGAALGWAPGQEG
jgi:O-antigen ligase